MGKLQKPDKKEDTEMVVEVLPEEEDAGGAQDEELEDDQEEEDDLSDAELREPEDEGFEDEREFSTINTALDNISEALDKLEEQNDQLNEQLRSLLAASRRIKNGMDSVNSFGASSSNGNAD